MKTEKSPGKKGRRAICEKFCWKYEFLWEIQANYVYSDGRCSAPFSHSVVYFISQLSSHFFSGNFQVQARVRKNFHVKVSKSRQILLFKQKEGAKKNGNFGVFFGLG